MDKRLVFISHIAEEKEVAIAVKELIESSFLGLIEVFVSSDQHSIGMGQKWPDQISAALKECVVEIVLCSPKSINRPWINFEAGAGWVRDISVIPLCHSGLDPSKLPMPLNLLQAAKAGEVSSLKLIFPVLAQAIGSKTPSTDFSDFVALVRGFEARYTFWDDCNAAFKTLNDFNNSIIPALKTGNPVLLKLSEIQFHILGNSLVFLKERKILDLRKLGGIEIGSEGMLSECTMYALPEFSKIISDEHFKF